MQPSTVDNTLPVTRWPAPSAGRNRAFRELYDRHFRLVWMVVRSGGVLPAHCEDVAQEVWLQVHRLVDRLRPEASARAWLVSITRRRVSQYHRTRRRRERKEAAFGETAQTDHAPHGGRVEARSTVDRVLDGMSDDQRLTFVLVHGYGLTGEEVASAVGDSVNTVYSRLRLARRHLGRASAAARLEEHRVAHAVCGYGQPPRGAQSRMRVVLALELGLPALTAVLPSSAAGVSAMGAAVVAGLTALRLWVGPLEPPVPRAGAATSLVAASEPAPDPAATTLTVASATPTSEPADGARPLASPVSAPIERPASAAATGPRRAARRSTSTPAHEPRSSSLSEETELLKQAKRALDGGTPERALALLDEHARRFPQATLDDVRQGVRVRALCAMGRRAQARQEAARLAAGAGDSVVALGVRDVCATNPEDDGDASR